MARTLTKVLLSSDTISISGVARSRWVQEVSSTSVIFDDSVRAELIAGKLPQICSHSLKYSNTTLSCPLWCLVSAVPQYFAQMFLSLVGITGLLNVFLNEESPFSLSLNLLCPDTLPEMPPRCVNICYKVATSCPFWWTPWDLISKKILH